MKKSCANNACQLSNNERQVPVPAIGDGVQPGVNKIPVVALLRLFEVAQSPKFVTTCRLVCKEWDDAACRYLRIHTFVKFREEESERLAQFRGLKMKQTQFELSNPFQNYFISFTSFTNRSFIQHLEQGNITVTSVELDASDSVQIGEFNKFLEKNQHCINHLYIYTDLDTLGNFGGEQIHFELKYLTELKFMDSCSEQCNHAPYLRSILAHSHPKILSLDVEFGGLIAGVLDVTRTYSELEVLSVFCYNNQTNSLEDALTLGALRLTESLKCLNLFWCNREQTSCEKIVPLFERISPYLEDLNLCSDSIPVQDLAYEWRKLKYLQTFITCSSFRGFSHSKFPSLMSVKFRIRWLELPTFHSPSLDPNYGVTCMELTDDDGLREERARHHSCICLFMCLASHFPNVQELIWDMPLTSRVCAALKSLYPGVKRLRMGDADSSFFCGIINAHDINTMMEMGWNQQKIPSELPIASLTF